MNSVPEISRWQEDLVDRTKGHFELTYGSVEDGDWRDWVPVAVVGPPEVVIATVQFLIESSDPLYADIVRDVTSSIQSILINKRIVLDPWEYAQYHCSTMSNIYSKVHWSFCEPRNRGQVKGWLTRLRQWGKERAG